MFSLKTKEEIDYMRHAGKILASIAREVEKLISPGISTYEINQFVKNQLQKNKASSSFLGYHNFPAEICASINEEAVHGIPAKNKILRNGDLFKFDLGVIYKGYHADAAWTFPVGTITSELQNLIDTNKSALDIGIKNIKTGCLLASVLQEIFAYATLRGYYFEGNFGGHGIGKALHEYPFIPHILDWGKFSETLNLKLHSGSTFTLEPILFLQKPNCGTEADNWTVVAQKGNYSAHFEHTIAVLDNAIEILTL